MLKLEEIKHTKVYQEALQEGKLEQKLAMISLLHELGLNVEQICDRLELDLPTVSKVLKVNK